MLLEIISLLASLPLAHLPSLIDSADEAAVSIGLSATSV
jgi:hypothetical protein